MERLKEKLKELRKKRGWVQEDLAREIGVSLSTVQRWESRRVDSTCVIAALSFGCLSESPVLTVRKIRQRLLQTRH